MRQRVVLEIFKIWQVSLIVKVCPSHFFSASVMKLVDNMKQPVLHQNSWNKPAIDGRNQTMSSTESAAWMITSLVDVLDAGIKDRERNITVRTEFGLDLDGQDLKLEGFKAAARLVRIYRDILVGDKPLDEVAA